MKHPILAAIAASILMSSSAFPLEIQGVKVPKSVSVDGETLALNGAGLRTVTIAFIPIKIYVAAFHAPAPLRTADAVLASPGPLQFNFTFLRAVNQSQVTQAWQDQMKTSVTYTYPGLDKDRAAFIGMFGPLAQGGVEMVQLVGTETRVYDSGKLKGSIPGRDFQKAFLSVWFGSNPAQTDLKTALLGH